jgi:hypothetical protein
MITIDTTSTDHWSAWSVTVEGTDDGGTGTAVVAVVGEGVGVGVGLGVGSDVASACCVASLDGSGEVGSGDFVSELSSEGESDDEDEGDGVDKNGKDPVVAAKFDESHIRPPIRRRRQGRAQRTSPLLLPRLLRRDGVPAVILRSVPLRSNQPYRAVKTPCLVRLRSGKPEPLRGIYASASSPVRNDGVSLSSG